MKKRFSTVQSNEEQLKEIRDRSGMSQQEVDFYLSKFQRFDTKQSGSMSKEDVPQYFKDIDALTRPECKKWLLDFLNQGASRTIEIKSIFELLLELRKFIEELEEEESINVEYIDAFVSMGGNADRSGTIMKDTIVNIIKNEFELTYNMEAFLEGFGENRQLDFDQFTLMFEQGGDDAKSMLTVTLLYIQYNLKAFSQRARSTSSFQGQSFHVRYRDFEKWLQQMDG